MIKCTFSVSNWQEDTVKSIADCTLKKASVTYAYSGDITGESDAEFLLLYLPDGSASFTAVEHIRGMYQGEPVTLVLNHHGMHTANVAEGQCSVTCATGALRDFRGTGKYAADAATVELTLRAPL